MNYDSDADYVRANETAPDERLEDAREKALQSAPADVARETQLRLAVFRELEKVFARARRATWEEHLREEDAA